MRLRTDNGSPARSDAAGDPAPSLPVAVLSRRQRAGLLMALLAAGLMSGYALSPALWSGFISDDAVNSLLSGVALEEHQSRSGHIFDTVKFWLLTNGRFFPLGFALNALSFVSDLGTYKLLSVLSVLVSVGCFAYLVYLIADSAAVALCVAAFPPLLFQFRLYHDPILSFVWMMPGLLALTCASLVCLLSYAKTGQRWRLVLGLAAHAAALLSYEIAFALLPLYALVALRARASSWCCSPQASR